MFRDHSAVQSHQASAAVKNVLFPMIVLTIVFPVLISSSTESSECCTQAEKVLSSPRHELIAKGAALRCSEQSVIPLGYPGAHESSAS